MSIFNVGITDILDKLPYDSSQITATTEPISTVKIEGFIKQVEGELVALLRKAGIRPESMSQEVSDQMAVAVRAFATSESLKALGSHGSEMDRYHQEYRDIYVRYDERPERLSGVSTKVKTNSGSRSKSRYQDKGYMF